MTLYEEYRDDFEQRASSVRVEAELEDLLGSIGAAAMDELTPLAEKAEDRSTAEELLISVEAWASLASYACTKFYFEGPNEVGTPLRRLGGWGKGVVSMLTDLVKRFGQMLSRAMHAIGATSYSVGVSYPFGVSVGLSW
ncbi:MAG TPA: hypothetical protein VLL27_15230 [Solirubrobacterales bacterium]|nr:hypothetical protein [Solirubrobacterales bacterium]